MKKKENEASDEYLELAEKLKILMACINMFDAEDLEILKKARTNLKYNINHNEAVMIVAIACGGDMYDSAEDVAKVEEFDGIIALIKARMKLRGVVIEKATLTSAYGNSFYR